MFFRVKLLVLVVVSLVFASTIILINDTVVDAAWLSDYNYRLSHNITGVTGAGTGYQINLTIWSNGTGASGDTCHLNNGCVSFPNDIRFTDNDEVTQLYYWIEDETSNPIRVWVRVNDSLDTNTEIFIYYGKSGVSSNSDGDNTFLQFIDWRDTELDYDTINLSSDAEVGDTWIHLDNVASLNPGEQLQIRDKSSYGSETGTYSQTAGSAENITIQSVASGNNSIQLTGGITRSTGYNVSDDAQVSRWYRHQSYSGSTPICSMMFFYDGETTTPNDIRMLSEIKIDSFHRSGDYSFASIGCGIYSNIDDTDFRYDEDFMAHRIATCWNTTSDGSGSAGIRNMGEDDNTYTVTYGEWQSNVYSSFSQGETWLFDYKCDSDDTVRDMYCYNTDGYILNKTAIGSTVYPDNINYFAWRFHAHEYGGDMVVDFYYDTSENALYVYNRDYVSNDEYIGLFYYWMATANYEYPGPSHGTWGGGGGSGVDYNAPTITSMGYSGCYNHSNQSVMVGSFYVNFSYDTSGTPSYFWLNISNDTGFSNLVKNVNITSGWTDGYCNESISTGVAASTDKYYVHVRGFYGS